MTEGTRHCIGYIAGVDEVGRGPLAGPVVAAAVILNPTKPILGLMDSKLLSAKRRNALYDIIINQSMDYAVGRAEPSEIDKLNVLNATMLAMQRALEKLIVNPIKVFVDGNCCPDIDIPAEAVIRGDQKIDAISAASIVAKVIRDREMVLLDEEYPGYGFAEHKGYGTKQHYNALKSLGVTPIHRRSFRLKRND